MTPDLISAVPKFKPSCMCTEIQQNRVAMLFLLFYFVNFSIYLCAMDSQGI